MAKSKKVLFDEVLRKHILNKNFVKIKRTIRGADQSIYGFILDFSASHVLLHVAEEFLLNGYYVFRKDQFDSLRCNAYDRTYKRIFKAEGQLEQVGLNAKIDLKNWQTIFQSIKKLNYNIIIECEDLKKPLFEIGPIKKVYKNQVHILYHDPNGVLEQKLTPVHYEGITIAGFGDRYSSVFNKYLKSS
jgi:hypothetical protein